MQHLFSEEILSKLKDLGAIDKLCDHVRLVNPVYKSVLEDGEAQPITISKDACYDVWGKNHICENCISTRAYMENKTFGKLEYSAEKVFMVTAVPVTYKDQKYVLEMMKENSDILLVNGTIDGDNTGFFSLIDQLNLLTVKDSLTDLYNKRYIDEMLPANIITTAANGNDLSLIMCDLDNFKKINDRYGRQFGDELLQDCALTIVESLKNTGDWVARYGGDKFLICLPNADLNTAAAAAEKIRDSIEKKTFPVLDDEIGITVSLGIASLKESNAVSKQKLIELVERKLHAAKNKGKNRIEY